MLVADNLASYGSMARFRDIERLIPVGKYTVIGVGGDISDLQYITRLLDDLTYVSPLHNHNLILAILTFSLNRIREQHAGDGHELRPEHVYEYMSRVMYNRRTKMDPLWNSILIAGTSPTPLSIQAPETSNSPKPSHGPFLSYVDLLGTTYSAPVIATGMGSAMGIPLLRKAAEDDAWKSLSREDARKVLDECMKVLYYRDARSLNKFSVATVTAEGITIEKNQTVPTEWEFARYGYGYK